MWFIKLHLTLHQSVPFSWLDTLQKLQRLRAEDIFVPGHGNVCDKSGLRDMSTLIQTWIDTVQKALDAGMTLEEAKKQVTMVGRFPYLTRDARTEMIEGMNITRLYEVLQKK